MEDNNNNFVNFVKNNLLIKIIRLKKISYKFIKESIVLHNVK